MILPKCKTRLGELKKPKRLVWSREKKTSDLHAGFVSMKSLRRVLVRLDEEHGCLTEGMKDVDSNVRFMVATDAAQRWQTMLKHVVDLKSSPRPQPELQGCVPDSIHMAEFTKPL